jgi:hypothetical protein
MTDYSDVPIVFTGDWIDAAWLNQYVGDNFRAFKQGLANAGDLPYAQDGNTIAALAKPASVDSFLRMLTTGVPEYVPKTRMPGILSVFGSNFSDSFLRTASTSFVTTTVEATVTLAYTSTILAFAFGTAKKLSGSHSGYLTLQIDGTNDTNVQVEVRSTTYTPFACAFRRTGRPSGSRLTRLMFRTENAADEMEYLRAYLMVFVIPEDA